MSVANGLSERRSAPPKPLLTVWTALRGCPVRNALVNDPTDDVLGTDAGVVRHFTQTSAHVYEHDASLYRSDAGLNTGFMRGVSQSGAFVAGLAAPDEPIYIFNVPSTLQPTLIQDSFEGASTNTWTADGNGQWQVAPSGNTHVFRQSNTLGNARMILDSPAMRHESIQADVVVHEQAGYSPWAGLMVRYTDPNNFYYLLADYLHQRIEIRKIENGSYGPIASAPFALRLNQPYKLRLEAIGSLLRAYVGDKLVTEIEDGTLKDGRVGLTMYRAKTDYDNVIVTGTPLTTLFQDDFLQTNAQRFPWSPILGSWTYVNNRRPSSRTTLRGWREQSTAHRHGISPCAWTSRPRSSAPYTAGSVQSSGTKMTTTTTSSNCATRIA